MGGHPLSLADVKCDSYILAGKTDHITPWDGCYQTRRLLGGRSEFVLSSSGHVQSIVNPPGGSRKIGFQTHAVMTHPRPSKPAACARKGAGGPTSHRG